MSQIVNHVLDPYNTPVLLSINRGEIQASIAEDLNKLALNEVFGFGDCKDSDWDKVMKRYLIMDMFSCTDAVSLDVPQLECLVGTLFTGLDKQVPCDKDIYFDNNYFYNRS